MRLYRTLEDEEEARDAFLQDEYNPPFDQAETEKSYIEDGIEAMKAGNIAKARELLEAGTD